MKTKRFTRPLAGALAVVYLATNCAFAHKPACLELPKPSASPMLPLLRYLPATVGSVRNVSIPKEGDSGKTVIHVQDVHRNAEAQRNIGRAVRELVNNKQVDLIALEGAFEPIDLAPFQTFPHRDTVRKVADHLLRENKISGPIHESLVNSTNIPIVGIDDPAHYAANVTAYRQSAPLLKNCKQRLKILEERLSAQKTKAFNPRLSAFDDRVQAYRQGKIPIGAYVQTLGPSAEIDLFLEALRLESTLNFSQVEAERSSLIARLMPKLTTAQTNGLMSASVAYQSGRLRHADFYSYLETLCRSHGISWAHSGAMREYLRYVLVSEKIDTERLFSSIRKREQQTYAALAKTSEEKRIVAESKRLHLTGKLLDFALTKEEWEEYKTIAAAKDASLKSFKDFYSEAEARDQAMAQNLLRAMDRAHAKTAILVTGGFHSAGIQRLMRDSGVTTLSFIPKISKVEKENVSAYLSVFTQEKTPLEKLFEGEKLFLAEAPFPKVHIPDVMAETAAQGLVSKKVEINQVLPWIESTLHHYNFPVAGAPSIEINSNAVVLSYRLQWDSAQREISHTMPLDNRQEIIGVKSDVAVLGFEINPTLGWYMLSLFAFYGFLGMARRARTAGAEAASRIIVSLSSTDEKKLLQAFREFGAKKEKIVEDSLLILEHWVIEISELQPESPSLRKILDAIAQGVNENLDFATDLLSGLIHANNAKALRLTFDALLRKGVVANPDLNMLFLYAEPTLPAEQIVRSIIATGIPAIKNWEDCRRFTDFVLSLERPLRNTLLACIAADFTKLNRTPLNLIPTIPAFFNNLDPYVGAFINYINRYAAMGNVDMQTYDALNGLLLSDDPRAFLTAHAVLSQLEVEHPLLIWNMPDTEILLRPMSEAAFQEALRMRDPVILEQLRIYLEGLPEERLRPPHQNHRTAILLGALRVSPEAKLAEVWLFLEHCLPWPGFQEPFLILGALWFDKDASGQLHPVTEDSTRQAEALAALEAGLNNGTLPFSPTIEAMLKNAASHGELNEEGWISRIFKTLGRTLPVLFLLLWLSVETDSTWVLASVPWLPLLTGPKKMRILHIEDEEGLRNLVGTVLNREGYEVSEAATPEEAVSLVRKNADGFDLIVSDVDLKAGENGVQLVLRLRREFPRLAAAPVLFSTSHDKATLRDLVQAEQPGSTFDFQNIGKPFSLALLKKQVAEQLIHRALDPVPLDLGVRSLAENPEAILKNAQERNEAALIVDEEMLDVLSKNAGFLAGIFKAQSERQDRHPPLEIFVKPRLSHGLKELLHRTEGIDGQHYIVQEAPELFGRDRKIYIDVLKQFDIDPHHAVVFISANAALWSKDPALKGLFERLITGGVLGVKRLSNEAAAKVAGRSA